MLGEGQIERVLREKAVQRLQRAVPDSADESPKAAMKRYAIADGCDCHALDPERIGEETDAFAHEHVCIAALHMRAHAEGQMSRRLVAQKPPATVTRRRSDDPYLVQLANLRIEDTAVAPRSCKAFCGHVAAIGERMTRIKKLEDKLEEEHAMLDVSVEQVQIIFAQLIDPILMSGYMHRSTKQRLQIALAYYLIRVFRVDLLLAIIMVGGFRDGDVPANLATERLHRIYEKFEDGLKRLERELQRSQRAGYRCVYLPVGQMKRMRDKRRHAADRAVKGQ